MSIKDALEEVYYPADLETDWPVGLPTQKNGKIFRCWQRLTGSLLLLLVWARKSWFCLSSEPSAGCIEGLSDWLQKFGGATGNYNAHHVAYPDFDWKAFGNKFVAEKLGLEREEYTTQISNYDGLGAIFDAMKRINTIMIDMNRDFWQYISMEYFKQKIKAGEVGSSAMPHKVNLIDFENAEGNLGMANAIWSIFLPNCRSRLQRDLTDSTVLRNIGVPFGHTVIAIQSSIERSWKNCCWMNIKSMKIDNCWSVVAEAIPDDFAPWSLSHIRMKRWKRWLVRTRHQWKFNQRFYWNTERQRGY